VNEAIGKLESSVNDKDRSSNSQYSRLQAHFSEMLSDAVLKASESERKLREEQTEKLKAFEKVRECYGLMPSPWYRAGSSRPVTEQCFSGCADCSA
jgi:hypothetical protein